MIVPPCDGRSVEAAAIAEGLEATPVAEGAAPVEGEAVPAAVEAEEPEEVDNTLTLTQYTAALAAKRQGAGFEELPPEPTAAPVKGKKITAEDLPDELDALKVEKRSKAVAQKAAKEFIDTSECSCVRLSCQP